MVNEVWRICARLLFFWSQMKRPAFTLVELLVVIAIIAVLSAILLPVFWTVRGKARQAACASNLHQVGRGVQMYMQDYDGRFPRAIDPLDKTWPSIWGSFPAFQSEISNLPLIQTCVRPYTGSNAVFFCPADTGFDADDFTGLQLNARPTSYEKFGTSYYYRTEVTATDALESSLTNPAAINLIFEGTGAWHGTIIPPRRRYNVLFVDGHVKNISEPQMSEAWSTPLSGS
jgi:prepilin-type N-terminal cleavage/methylation domain-containing protein/prepilin-type processing-associated H-X9-DG protein